MLSFDSLKRRLQKLGYPHQPRAERLPAQWLEVRRSTDAVSTPAHVKDISATGIYVLTGERWPLGDLVSLTLHSEPPQEAPLEPLPTLEPAALPAASASPEESAPPAVQTGSKPEFEVQARVTRHGEDGVGLSFVLPQGLNPDLWRVLIHNAAVLEERKEVVHMFRVLRTILFLCRICQSEAGEAFRLLGGELDEARTECALDIAIAAEKALAADPDAARMRAHPPLVASILRHGSWSSDELTRQFWSGLLVGSCTVDEPDGSNQTFADVLVHITPTQARIFQSACTRALEIEPAPDGAPSARIVFQPQQMIEMTGIYDLSRITTDMAYLYNLGLISKVFNFTSYLPAEEEEFDATPSALGLALFQHCRGAREKPSQQIVEAASTHLAGIIPQLITDQIREGGAPTYTPGS